MIFLIVGIIAALAIFLGFMHLIEWQWGLIALAVATVAVVLLVIVLILQGLYEVDWCSAKNCRVWGS